ncbi:hypothetical protein [Aliidiomarina minuta]|nr:hypothetical protein [Aliidiomarina minuta]
MRKLEIILAIILFLAGAVIMNSCGSSDPVEEQGSEQITPAND